MSNSVIGLDSVATRDDDAKWVSNLWTNWDAQRQGWKDRALELDKYLYATDTTTTSNSALPWKNSTTLPKLTQLSDNLHSNYISSVFPNDKWLKWQAHNAEAANRQKVKTITSYMENKTRMGGFRETTSLLLMDYIRRGVCFSMPSFEKRYNLFEPDDALMPTFIGPRAVRINPVDIVFDAKAVSFEAAPKIIRSIKTIGELKLLAESSPEQSFWNNVIEDHLSKRNTLAGYKENEINKVSMYQDDGFGSLAEYYKGSTVEVLEFYGDYYDENTDTLHKNRMITIAGRSVVARNEPIATYDGKAPIFMSGWRTRPDNLWAMGPLDNLVGMQYRIDHLENLKADAMDLIVHPPLKIIGEVEDFVWGPGAMIHIDENGDVQEVSSSMQAIVIADNQISDLENRMELYAGAPREAMGVRSPGEKTAFEVQRLENASGRIFQEKITHFEITTLEPLLNSMLETARRNTTETDVISTLDRDLGSVEFNTITAEDITAKGIIRPVGARHFAQQAQDLQNMMGIVNTPIWAKIEPHTSAKALTEYFDDMLSLSAYKLFRPNIGVIEAQESQGLLNQAQEDLEVEASGPIAPETVTEEVPEEGQV